MGEKVKKTKAWIAPVGWSPMAVVNTIWAYYDKFHCFPDEYYLLYQDTPRIKKDLDIVCLWLSKFHQKLPFIKKILLNDDSVKSFLDGLSFIMRDLLKQSIPSAKSVENKSEIVNESENLKEIILDMTPGRKFMSMVMGIVGLNKPKQISAVYYNYIVDDRYYNDPLPLIPKIDQELYNILEYQKDLLNFPILPDPMKKQSELSKIVEEIIINQSPNGISKTQIKKQLQNQNITYDFKHLETIFQTLVESKQIKIKQIQGTDGKLIVFYSETIKSIEKKDEKIESIPSEKKDSIDYIPKILTSIESPKSFSSCYLNLNELIMLLNELYEYRFEKIRIEAAPFGLHLGDFFIDEQINFEYNNQAFNEQTNTELNVPQNIIKEIDISKSWSDLLIMAGLVLPENFDEIKNIIQNALNYNPLNGELPPVIGMDSNLFRFRFYSLYRNYIYDSKFQKRVGFCTSETVRYELNYSQKYSIADMDQLLSAIPSYNISTLADSTKWYEEIVQDFSNQNKFIDRKKRLGMEEYSACIQNEITFNCEKSKQTSDNDFLIIDEMKNFIANHDFRLFAMSNDKDFIGKSKGIPNIKPILVDYPRSKIQSKLKVKWKQFLQYLYCTAIWYGGILLIDASDNSFNPIAAINGIWKGKDDSDWQECKLKIKANEDILKPIKKNLKLIY